MFSFTPDVIVPSTSRESILSSSLLLSLISSSDSDLKSEGFLTQLTSLESDNHVTPGPFFFFEYCLYFILFAVWFGSLDAFTFFFLLPPHQSSVHIYLIIVSSGLNLI